MTDEKKTPMPPPSPEPFSGGVYAARAPMPVPDSPEARALRPPPGQRPPAELQRDDDDPTAADLVRRIDDLVERVAALEAFGNQLWGADQIAGIEGRIELITKRLDAMGDVVRDLGADIGASESIIPPAAKG